jgi:AbrB family looped-hinge helix DNA binding protein
METVRVSSKGQVVIPKSLRESHHIDAGTELIITAVGGELRLKPVKASRQATLRQVAGVLQRKGARKPSGAEEAAAIGRLLVGLDEASKK